MEFGRDFDDGPVLDSEIRPETIVTRSVYDSSVLDDEIEAHFSLLSVGDRRGVAAPDPGAHLLVTKVGVQSSLTMIDSVVLSTDW